MQPGGRFVPYLQHRPTLHALLFGRELHALCFAAGEFGEGLAEPKKAEPDLADYSKRALKSRIIYEES